MENLKKALPAIQVAAIVLTALWALLFQVRLPGKLPTEAEFQAAAELLTQDAKPGDVLLLFPWWTEHARLFMPDSLPVVGYLGSDSDSLERHPRIWVLSQPELPGNRVGDFERDFNPGRNRLAPPRRFGHLELSLFQNGRYRPTYFSATDSVAAAHVYIEQSTGTRVDCPFDGKAHRCPGSTVYVAAEWHELHYAPKRCLWMKPPGGSARLVAEFPNLPARGELSLFAGLTWDREYLHEPRYSPVNLGVDAWTSAEPLPPVAPLLRLSIPPATSGIQRTSTSPPNAPEGFGARIWTQADNSDDRDVCVELAAQGTPGLGS